MFCNLAIVYWNTHGRLCTHFLMSRCAAMYPSSCSRKSCQLYFCYILIFIWRPYAKCTRAPLRPLENAVTSAGAHCVHLIPLREILKCTPHPSSSWQNVDCSTLLHHHVIQWRFVQTMQSIFKIKKIILCLMSRWTFSTSRDKMFYHFSRIFIEGST